MDFQLGPYGLEIPTEFGPRVTGLRLGPGPNVMAVLDDDMGLGDGPDRYRFHGGHRIWASPEIPEISYAPDDHPCAVTERDGRITVIAPPDRAGIAKELSVRLDGDRLVVTNALVPAVDSSAEIAPWAISQLPGEGLAILPLNGEDTTPLPNRQIVLWPYTSVTDPRIGLTDGALLVTAADGPNLKVGVGPGPRRSGYWHQGQLFVKELAPVPFGSTPDLGARAQVFVGSGFCELESVGSLAPATAGRPNAIEERWRVVPCEDMDTAIRVIVEGT